MQSSILVLASLFSLIVVPQLTRPFSAPKTFVLGLALAVGALLAAHSGIIQWPRLPAAFQAAFAAWLAALGISASFGAFVSLNSLLLPVFGAGWFLLVLLVRPPPKRLLTALAISAGVVACIAVLQFLGLNPFAVAGWTATGGGSPRMRVYSTLGNPNFVAALLMALIPATAGVPQATRRDRALFSLLLGVEVIAVLATGSRAAVLAAAAVCLWLALLRKLPGSWKMLAAAAVVAIGLLAFSDSRPLRTTIEGRLYVWRVVASHFHQVPLAGFGPGAFAAQYAQWEIERWRTAPPPQTEARFAGVHDHAHNDYLEVLVDHGLTGLAAFLAVIFSFLLWSCRQVRQSKSQLVTASSTGVVALLAVALVDFPFSRPAEQFVFWTLMAVAYLAAGSEECGGALETSA